MRFIERMLAVVLAAGLVSACSNEPDACTEYDNAEELAHIDLSMTNLRDTPIYVHWRCEPVFELVAGGITHQPAPFWLELDIEIESQPSCEMVKHGVKAVPCYPESELLPMEGWRQTWLGLFYEETQMPGRCLASSQPATCWRAVPAPAGPIQVVWHAYATKDCSGDAGCVYTDPISVRDEFMYVPGLSKNVDVNFLP